MFRLPGFNHCKDEPYLVECLKYNPELRYTQEELEKHLPVVVEENAPTVISGGVIGVGSSFSSVCGFTVSGSIITSSRIFIYSAKKELPSKYSTSAAGLP